MPASIIPMFVAALTVVVVTGTALILLGCWLLKADNPGVLRAAWVNLIGVGAISFANFFIAAVLWPLYTTLRERSPADADQTMTLVTRCAQVPADIAILALGYSRLLDKLPYRRALVLSVVVAAGLAAVLLLTTHAMSAWLPQPGPERNRLRGAKAHEIAPRAGARGAAEYKIEVVAPSARRHLTASAVQPLPRIVGRDVEHRDKPTLTGRVEANKRTSPSCPSFFILQARPCRLVGLNGSCLG